VRVHRVQRMYAACAAAAEPFDNGLISLDQSIFGGSCSHDMSIMSTPPVFGEKISV